MSPLSFYPSNPVYSNIRSGAKFIVMISFQVHKRLQTARPIPQIGVLTAIFSKLESGENVLKPAKAAV
jgi:hypothetical protein